MKSGIGFAIAIPLWVIGLALIIFLWLHFKSA